MTEALLCAEVIVFVMCFKYIFSRDRLFGVFFLFLVVYALPAQIGYYYYSDLSTQLGAYFDSAVWYPACEFVILSLACFWALFALMRNRIAALIPVVVRVVPARGAAIPAVMAMLVVVVIVLYELSYLLINYADVSWYTAQDESFVAARPGYALYLTMFKLSVAVALVLYALVRQRRGLMPRTVQLAAFAGILAAFLAGAIRLGNRTDLLALGLGVAVFESYIKKLTPGRMVAVILTGAVAFSALMVLGLMRYEQQPQDLDVGRLLLANDYYAPAHILFAAMAYAVVDPGEVLASNAANALVLMNHPYLQATITDIFNPGLATRSAGYAFYVLTEGYLVLGFAGFAYNGLVLMLGMSVWRRLAETNSRDVTAFLLALMGCMVVNLVRGQTSYFIKYLYTFVLPGLMLYAALAGISLRFRLAFAVGLPVAPPPGEPARRGGACPDG